MNPSRPPIHQIEDSMRPTWMAGDFGVVAKTIFAGAEALVSFLAIPFSAYMLDVAYGTGNVAIPLARQGTVVTGVDIPLSPRPSPSTCHRRRPHRYLRRRRCRASSSTSTPPSANTSVPRHEETSMDFSACIRINPPRLCGFLASRCLFCKC